MLCPRCGYYSEKEENVCPECGEILNDASRAVYGGAEAIRQGKRARQAIREKAEQISQEVRKRRRSGSSHATIEMPAVADNREEEESYPEYTVSERDGMEEEDEDGEPVFERRRRTVYDEDAALEEQARAYAELVEQNGRNHRKMVNWMKLTMILAAVLVLAVAGVWLFLNKTDNGQKLLARLGKEATSSAL